MAKRRKAPPARKPRVAPLAEHSLLLRSAESLGRVIGTLQRQLDEATRQLARANDEDMTVDTAGNGNGPKKVRRKKTATKRKRTTH
jgi:hypothetical protein